MAILQPGFRPWALWAATGGAGLIALCVLLVLALSRSVEQTPSDVLQHYVLSDSDLGGAYRAADVQEWSNPLLAASLQDPVQIRSIVEHGRVSGLSQSVTPLPEVPQRTITIFSDLFLESDGAQAFLADASQTVNTVGFARGRLAIRLVSAAPSQQLQPLVTILANRADQHPPPPPAQAERDLVAAQTTPTTMLHDAYRLLLDNAASPLEPRILLESAYRGAAHSVAAESASPPEITAVDPEQAWSQFLVAYAKLHTDAPRDLAYAAATQMYRDQRNCHDAFYRPEAYERALQMGRGQATALMGVHLTAHQPILVTRVTPGSPAERADLRPGDEILAVDHQSAHDAGDDAVGQLIVGEPGSTTTLTIVRPGLDTPFDVPVGHALLPAQIERHRRLDDRTGYLELDSFVTGDTSVQRVEQALAEMRAAGPLGGLVLDLRYNSGGIEVAMQRIASLFVPIGSPIFTVIDRDSTTHNDSIGAPSTDQPPLVILISGETASSAEMLTQALHDLGRATLVGSPSAGCVNGGHYYGLLDSSGVLVSTQIVLAGPHDVPLEGIGIKPDVPVERTRVDLAAGRDPQLDSALALLHREPGS